MSLKLWLIGVYKTVGSPVRKLLHNPLHGEASWS